MEWLLPFSVKDSELQERRVNSASQVLPCHMVYRGYQKAVLTLQIPYFKILTQVVQHSSPSLFLAYHGRKPSKLYINSL